MSGHVGISFMKLEEEMAEEKEKKNQLKSLLKMQKTKEAQAEALAQLIKNTENPEDLKYPETPSGHKKLLPSLMPHHYSHLDVEKSWCEWWDKAGYSKPPSAFSTSGTHTGAGHAIQDTLVRWNRMSGYNTLWVPGIHTPELDLPKHFFGYGADALRFSLLSYTAQSDTPNLDKECVVRYQQWCDKLWTAVRFALTKFGHDYTPPTKIVPHKMPSSCRWILSALNKAISKTISSLDSYEFSGASSSVYSWWNYHLCDIFIELIKPYFFGKNVAAKNYARDTLWVCLEYGLRLLHPFMPYLTEELWQRLPSPKHYSRKESIMICEYPSVEESWTNEKLEYEMDMIESAVRSLRSCRTNLPAMEPDRRPAGFIISRTDQIEDLFRRYVMEVSTLAKLSSLEVLTEDDDAPAGCAVSIVNEQLSVYLKFQGGIDVKKKRENRCAKLAELQKQINSLDMAMCAEGYAEQVSSHMKEENFGKLVTLMTQAISIEEATPHFRRRVSASHV